MHDVMVAFGTETGTAEDCAQDLGEALAAAGISCRVRDMFDVLPSDLPSDDVFVVVTSTFGNGDAPSNADELLSHLTKERPDLSGQRFAVMALGDSTYPRFAQCGRDFDQVLEELGGVRIAERVDADVDVEEPLEAFQGALLRYLLADAGPQLQVVPTATPHPPKKPSLVQRLRGWLGGSGEVGPSGPSRATPGLATLTDARVLSRPGSTKDTRHYVLQLDGPHDLQPGDSVGLLPDLPPDRAREGSEAPAPRLYSVANDPRGGPVDLCVDTVRYEQDGRIIEGIASCWLADRVPVGAEVRWYPAPQPRFHLPERGPLILVGPGTGIAPFRGFLQRLARTSPERQTWLFFGHRHEAFDNLYGEELAAWTASGVLNHCTYAWSRDQDHKLYVQHRIAEHGRELWSWLEAGATVMVCGDASGMAPGVRDAFRALADDRRGDGRGWLAEMRRSGRYREDVY